MESELQKWIITNEKLEKQTAFMQTDAYDPSVGIPESLLEDIAPEDARDIQEKIERVCILKIMILFDLFALHCI